MENWLFPEQFQVHEKATTCQRAFESSEWILFHQSCYPKLRMLMTQQASSPNPFLRRNRQTLFYCSFLCIKVVLLQIPSVFFRLATGVKNECPSYLSSSESGLSADPSVVGSAPDFLSITMMFSVGALGAGGGL